MTQLGSRDFEVVDRVANAMADAAGQVVLPQFRRHIAVTNKAGAGRFDPVTQADKDAEKVMREIITQHFPEDGIVGEEYGVTAGTSGYRWILDPIDGTGAFISGLAHWGTLIALHNGECAVFGLMDQPFLGERYSGFSDKAQLITRMQSAHEISVRACSDLCDATLMTTTPDMFVGKQRVNFEQVRQQVAMTRYGGDCYSYCMLASGFSDLIIETNLQVYDIQALIPIITGAGGVVSNWHGEPVIEGGDVVAAGDKRVHAQALTVLQSAA